MTPQGLTLTENYLLISAYCHDHQHHSVIYVLDRITGVKIKRSSCLICLTQAG